MIEQYVEQYVNLVVAVLEKSTQKIFFKVVTNLNGVDVDTWDLLFYQLHYTP